VKIALGIPGHERWIRGHAIIRDLFASVRDLRLLSDRLVKYANEFVAISREHGASTR
jgi:hypothetical protein